MPIFECSKCATMENTALGEYWGVQRPLCSECATGQWHGRFPKRTAKEAGYEKNEDGFYGPRKDQQHETN